MSEKLTCAESCPVIMRLREQYPELQVGGTPYWGDEDPNGLANVENVSMAIRASDSVMIERLRESRECNGPRQRILERKKLGTLVCPAAIYTDEANPPNILDKATSAFKRMVS
jgi:hypothetical protein